MPPMPRIMPPIMAAHHADEGIRKLAPMPFSGLVTREDWAAGVRSP